MKVGDIFSSYEELENALKAYEEEYNVHFRVVDSRSLELAKKDCPKLVKNVSELGLLKYYFIKFRCVYGGIYKKRKTVKGVRQTSSMKKGCEAFIYAKCNKLGKLIISKMSDIHNHEASKLLFLNSPGQKSKNISDMDILTQNVSETTMLEQESISDNKEVLNVSYFPSENVNHSIKTEDESLAVEALNQLGSMVNTLTYSCDICYVTFSRKVDLEDHLMFCEPISKTVHRCNDCLAVFFRKIDLTNHEICHQVQSPHVCSICRRLYREEIDLNNHMRHHEIQPYRCFYCGIEFQRASSLSNHTKTHRKSVDMNTASFCCASSNFYSNKPEQTIPNDVDNQQINKAFDSLPSICSEYYKMLTDGSNECIAENSHASVANIKEEPQEIKENKDEEIDKKPYRCHHCNIGFSRSKALASHCKLHEDHWGSLVECENCGETFPNEDVYASHRDQCTRKTPDYDRYPPFIKEEPNIVYKQNRRRDKQYIKIKKHLCTICGRAFSTKQKLFRHTWIHREKKYICEICCIALNNQGHLDDHRLNVHAARTPFSCGSCGKSFVSRQGLWEHMRVHGEDELRRFKCTACNKIFTSRQGLVVHTRTHTGERPYACRYCRKAFLDGGTRRKHERIHTGERPHVCPLCHRAFIQKVVLREHLRWVHIANTYGTHSDDVPGTYGCQLCNRELTNKEELCAHFVKHSDTLAAMVKTTVDKTKNSVVGENGRKTKNKNPIIRPRRGKGKMSLLNKASYLPVNTKKCKSLKIASSPKIVLKRAKKKFEAKRNISPPKNDLCYSETDFDANKDTEEFDNCNSCAMCSTNFKSRKELLNHISVHIM